jgi:hypothetical protein
MNRCPALAAILQYSVVKELRVLVERTFSGPPFHCRVASTPALCFQRVASISTRHDCRVEVCMAAAFAIGNPAPRFATEVAVHSFLVTSR